MKRLSLLATLLPLTLAPSCPIREFEVRMERTPEGRVRRELLLWTEQDGIQPPQPDVLPAAQHAYCEEGEEKGRKLDFHGVFGAALPADLAHAGTVNRAFVASSTSPVGELLTYSERMPGQTRPLELIQAAEKFSAALSRALAAYVRQHPELACDPEGLACLTEFLETEGRDDVTNVLLLAWLGFVRVQVATDAAGESTGEAQTTLSYAEGLRIADYLLEREYLQADEMSPVWQEVLPRLMHGIVRKVATIAGHPADGPWPIVLARLANPETSSDEFEGILDEGLAAIGSSKDALSNLLQPAFPSFLGTSTSGRVVWHCKTRPLMTNGQWDDDKDELSWKAEGRTGCAPPQMLFAVWAEPHEQFQRAHFGTVALSGQRLFEYAGWRAALSPPECTAWDAFIERCQPGPELTRMLKEFRLPATSTMPATQPEGSTPNIPRGAELILEGL
jgi:hypothetical protein